MEPQTNRGTHRALWGWGWGSPLCPGRALPPHPGRAAPCPGTLPALPGAMPCAWGGGIDTGAPNAEPRARMVWNGRGRHRHRARARQCRSASGGDGRANGRDDGNGNGSTTGTRHAPTGTASGTATACQPGRNSAPNVAGCCRSYNRCKGCNRVQRMQWQRITPASSPAPGASLT